MRNLKLTNETRVSPVLTPGTVATCSCISSELGLCIYAAGSELQAVSTQSGEIQAALDLGASGLLVPGSDIVALHCLADVDGSAGETAAAVVATSEGDLLVWHTSTGQVDCVGSVESGIAAMCWSPDGELFVLCTGAATIILMTKDFDPVMETEFHQQQFGAAALITVGWGKKETQFHGSEGKAAALTKSEAVKELAAWDDLRPRVRWRGDGQYFVVSAVDVVEGARKLRVWSRDGALHSTSQAVDGCIEQALDWKPSGSLIVTSQGRPQKHEIVFFELNGLRHGEFTLPFSSKDVKVKEIQWNSDSTILMVWCEELKEPKLAHIQLWTVGNYHWYLKHSLRTKESDAAILSVAWDPAVALRLYIVRASGALAEYNWSWITSAACCLPDGAAPDDDAAVAVVDGVKLLVTPFLQMVAPPPLCAYSLQLDRVPSCVAVAPSNIGERQCLVAACDGTLFVFAYDCNGNSSRSKLEAAAGQGFRAQCRLPSLKAAYRLPADLLTTLDMSMSSIRHVTWLSDAVLAFAILNTDVKALASANDRLYVVSLTGDVSNPSSDAVLEHTVDVAGQILCISAVLQKKQEHRLMSRLAIQLLDGTVLCWSSELGLNKWTTDTTGRPLKFPVACPQMAACTLGGQLVLCGLSNNYRFFVDEVELASDCTSFGIHNDFLLLTTYSHTLHCIPRDRSPAAAAALCRSADERTGPHNETVRRVERGSRIVAVVPSSTKVVLQMPRGNLEVVHPRALVIAAVRRALDLLHYREALNLVRRHRISMNILFDHNPVTFLNNAISFVHQIDQVQLLNEFITDLQNEDVCSTMYSAYYDRTVPKAMQTFALKPRGLGHSSTALKIDVVCDSLHGVFVSQNASKYTLAILTAYAKKTKPELEKALFLIKSLRASCDTCEVTADEALKYLLFLVDVHRLYDIALGTYDFDLALMVAERSHMDPKEYLPFLNEVRPLETNYQRFKIDQRLRRFEKALSHLSKCSSSSFDECLRFTDEHQLYTFAMTLYAPLSDEYKQVVTGFCKHLVSLRRHEEAGLLYMHVSQHCKAMDCFRECGSWQHFVSACHLAATAAGSEMPAEFVAQCRSMADGLRRRKLFLDAARLFEQYVKDEEEAVACLVEGSHWDEALRLVHGSRRSDLEVTHIRPAIEAAARDSAAMLQSNTDVFIEHTRRLQQVRLEKAANLLEVDESFGPVLDEGGGDLFSDAGSTVAGSHVTATSRSGRSTAAHTKSTGRSSKNRRKMERKKWSLKEGSPFEELALMEALKQLIEQTDAAAADLGRLLRVLVFCGLLEEAAELQHAYEQALSIAEAGIPKIWIPDVWPCGHGSTHGGATAAAQHVTSTAPTGRASVASLEQQLAGVSWKEDQTATAFGTEQHVRVPPVMRHKMAWALSLLKP